MMMATPGNLVVRDSGKLGVLTTGTPAVFNASGECPSCCGGEIPLCCQQGYAVQMPGTGDRPGLALSLACNMWALLWTGPSQAQNYYHGLPAPLDLSGPPLTGYSFTGSEETGGATFTKSCGFSTVSATSPEQTEIIRNPNTGTSPVNGYVTNSLSWSQRSPGTTSTWLRLRASVTIKRLFEISPSVSFLMEWSIQDPGDPVVFDWELTRIFNGAGGSPQSISIDRAGMEFHGIAYHNAVTTDAAGPGGLPTTCDLRIAYLPEMGGPLHPIFDDAVPFDLSHTFRYFDVAVVFDVTEAPVFCPGVG